MSAIAEQTTVSPTALDRMRERASSAYLGVSRDVGVYAGTVG